MAKELSRTFNLEHGAVVRRVQDALGRVSVHTHYLVKKDGTANDVAAEIAASDGVMDKAAAALQAALQSAGWKPGGN
jgi:hypothetical protein